MKDLKTPKGWRKGQAIFNFLWWLKEKEGYDPEVGPERMADPFNIDDKKFEELYDEFLIYYAKNT